MALLPVTAVWAIADGQTPSISAINNMRFLKALFIFQF